MKKVNRLIVVLLSLAVLLMAFGIGATIHYAHQSKEISMLNHLDADVHTLFDSQENMQTALESLAAFCSDMQTLSSDELITIMNSLAEQYGFSYVARIEADGSAFNNKGENGFNLSDRDYFRAGMDGKTTTSFLHRDQTDSVGYLLTAVPVYKDGKPDGIVHGSYTTDSYLSKLMQELGDETLILLLDMNGDILTSQGMTKIEGNVTDYTAQAEDTSRLLADLNTARSDSIDLILDGVGCCATYAPLRFDNSSFYVLIAAPTDSIPLSFESFWHSAGLLLSINAFLVLILLATSFILRKIQIQRMKTEMERSHYEALAVEQKMYHTIIDQTANAIVVIDIKTHEVLYANVVALNLLAEEPAAFIGAHCYRCIAHNDAPCKYCPIENGVVVPHSREFVIKGRRYQQDFKPILWHGREALVEYNRDITRVMQLISDLNQQKEKYQGIYNSLPCGVVEFTYSNRNVRFTGCNELMLQMTGYQREEFLTDIWHGAGDIVHEDSLEVISEIFHSLHHVDDVRSFEYRMRRKDNVYKWVSGTLLVRAIDADGIRILGAVNDEDARKKAESESSAKSRFLSRMSHEIRTPINAIMGIAELEKQDLEAGNISKANISKYARETVTASEYLLSLVNDILDTSRIENNSIEIQQDVINAADYLEGIQKLVETFTVRRDITFTMERKTHLRASYIGDAVRVKQVVMNLLNNAFKFTPPGGIVKLTAEAVSETKEHTMLQFTVADTGIGISKEFQKKLFTPFTQEASDNTSPYSGSGLGLSIAKELTRLMGGDLVCHSEKGKGSTFIATIRVGNPQEDSQKPEPVNRIEKLDFTGIRILVCEDHPLNQKITRALLERKHCSVEIAADGVIGLDMFQKSPIGYYSMILMDIRMPNMDGLQTTREIRKLQRGDASTVPIVAMSANAFDEDVYKSLAAGMNEHLAKPVDATKLYHAVATYAHLSVEAAEGKPIVLVVDDVEVNRVVVCEALKRDYTIMVAENGKLAMQLLNRHPNVVAVVTDVQMPEMDGIELVRTIRSEYRFEDVAILANTQFGDRTQEQLLISLGADDFVYKPTEPSVLATRLKNALARRKHIL